MTRLRENDYHFWVWSDKPRERRWVRQLKKWEARHRRALWPMLVPIVALMWTANNGDPFALIGQQEPGYADRPRRVTQLVLSNECPEHSLEVFINHVKAEVIDTTWAVSGMFLLEPGETLQAVKVASPEVWFHARARKLDSLESLPVQWPGSGESDCDSFQPTKVTSSQGTFPLPADRSAEPFRLCGWLFQDIGDGKSFTMPFRCDPPIVATRPTASIKVSLRNECPGHSLEVFANYVQPGGDAASRVLAGMFLLQPGETIYALDTGHPAVYFHAAAQNKKKKGRPPTPLPGNVDGCDTFEFYEVTTASSRQVLPEPRVASNLCNWEYRDAGRIGGNVTMGFKCPSLRQAAADS